MEVDFRHRPQTQQVVLCSKMICPLWPTNGSRRWGMASNNCCSNVNIDSQPYCHILMNIYDIECYQFLPGVVISVLSDFHKFIQDDTQSTVSADLGLQMTSPGRKIGLCPVFSPSPIDESIHKWELRAGRYPVVGKICQWVVTNIMKHFAVLWRDASMGRG